MANQSKILNLANSVLAHFEMGKVHFELAEKKASMLKLELSGVVSGNSPQKGKNLPATAVANVISKREKSRLRK